MLGIIITYLIGVGLCVLLIVFLIWLIGGVLNFRFIQTGDVVYTDYAYDAQSGKMVCTCPLDILIIEENNLGFTKYIILSDGNKYDYWTLLTTPKYNLIRQHNYEDN